jgi:hypothetical protein
MESKSSANIATTFQDFADDVGIPDTLICDLATEQVGAHYFYDQVWYWDEKKTDMNTEQRKIGRWLGIAHRVGSEMTYWILTKGAMVIARSTIQHITTTDMEQDAIKAAVQAFDTTIEARLSDENFTINEPGIFYMDDDDADDANEQMIPNDEEYGDMLQDPKPDIDDIEIYNKYLNSEFVVDRGGEQVRAKVIKRARSDSGYPIGTAHVNPMLDTREYECVTDDGTVERYTANMIAENIFAQCDDEGKRYTILDEIIEHAKDGNDAIDITNGFITSANGNRISKKTTRGWKLLCSWKDGSSDWVDLKELKDSNPIEVAEYAVANNIQEEPAFKWWVGDVLRRRNRIINKVKSRYWKLTHKFGIRLPHLVQEALRIDEGTGTMFWTEAIKKELKKVSVAFKLCDDWTPEQIRQGLARGDFVGYQEI